MIALLLATTIAATLPTPEELKAAVESGVRVSSFLESQKIYQAPWSHSTSCLVAEEGENALDSIDQDVSEGFIWNVMAGKKYTLTPEGRVQVSRMRTELQADVRKWQHRCHD
jgi:hypothetical protein